ncbi:MAG: hypothetical protein DRQ51_06105 [Gammaproteobacteria bacterium]|nr:MAG: hypothetical protein DRQ51_06105 [Gammaproteobacteria bacterium]
MKKYTYNLLVLTFVFFGFANSYAQDKDGALDRIKATIKLVETKQHDTMRFKYIYNLMKPSINEYCKNETSLVCVVPANTISYTVTQELRDIYLENGVPVMLLPPLDRQMNVASKITIEKYNHTLDKIQGNPNFDYLVKFEGANHNTIARYDIAGKRFMWEFKQQKTIVHPRAFKETFLWQKVDDVDVLHFTNTSGDNHAIVWINPGKLTANAYMQKNLVRVWSRNAGKLFNITPFSYTIYSTLRADKNGGVAKSNHKLSVDSVGKWEYKEKEKFDQDGKRIAMGRQNEDGSWTFDVSEDGYGFDENDAANPIVNVKIADTIYLADGSPLSAVESYNIGVVPKDTIITNLVNIQATGSIVDKNMNEVVDASDVVLEYFGSKLHLANKNSSTDTDNLDIYYIDDDQNAQKLTGIWLERVE